MRLILEGDCDELREFILGPAATRQVPVLVKVPQMVKASSSRDKKGLTAPDEIEKKEPGDKFVLKECEPFLWNTLPTYMSGKTMYHMQGDRIHILRDGYGEVHVYAVMRDIKYLQDHPDKVKSAVAQLYDNKQYVLKGFLKDVKFSMIGSDEHRIRQPAAAVDPEKDPDEKYKPQLKGVINTRCDGDGSKLEKVMV